jgi:hypothetical protein
MLVLTIILELNKKNKQKVLFKDNLLSLEAIHKMAVRMGRGAFLISSL